MNPQHFVKYDVTKQSKPVNKNELDLISISEDLERITTLVFEPDPLTGWPRSDVSYMLSGSDPAFKQFIKDNLMSAQPQSVLAEDPDTAAALVKKNLMTPNQYMQMVFGYVNELRNAPATP